MTTNPPTITTPPGTEYTEVDLEELARQFPPVSFKEWAEDREWFAEQLRSGSMDALYGKVVAIYNRRVIGVGDDYIAMLLQLSEQYNVSPARIAVVDLGE